MTTFVNLLKATRVYRTLPVLMIILVSAAFADRVNREIIVLGIGCILVYMAAGIHNAIKDKDYTLPFYSKKVMLLLLSAAVTLSFFHYVIFLTITAWIFLGYVYNTLSRFVLFGDTTVLSITHFALPSLSASVLLGLDFRLTIALSGVFFLIAWLITHTKNLKDTQKDKDRNYITLTTQFSYGVLATKILLFVSFAIMLASYFLFNLTTIFILVLASVFFLILLALRRINRKREDQGLGILRLAILTFLLGLIIEKTSSYLIFLSGFFLYSFYLLLFVTFNINRTAIKNTWSAMMGYIKNEL